MILCNEGKHFWVIYDDNDPKDEERCMCGKCKWKEIDQIEIPAERLEILYS